MPRVSVVIPCYNAEGYIGRAIGSVQAQSMDDWEILAVDDRSSDRTMSLLQDYAGSDARVRVFQNPVNSGPSAARNVAFAHASGEFIAILDADDAFREDRLARMLSCAGETEADLVFDNLVFYDDFLKSETGRTRIGDAGTGHTPIGARDLISAEGPRSTLKYGFLKPVFRTEFLQRHHLRYSETLRLAEDFDLYLRCLLSGAQAVLMTEAFYIYTTQAGHSSGVRSQGTRTLYEPEARVGMMARILDDFGSDVPSAILRLLKRCLAWQQLYADTHRLVELRQMRRWREFWALSARRPAAFRHFLRGRKLFRKPGNSLRIAAREIHPG